MLITMPLCIFAQISISENMQWHEWYIFECMHFYLDNKGSNVQKQKG